MPLTPSLAASNFDPWIELRIVHEGANFRSMKHQTSSNTHSVKGRTLMYLFQLHQKIEK